MRHVFPGAIPALILGVFSSVALAQTTRAAASFDPHDLSGYWSRTSPLETYANVPGSVRGGGAVAEAPLTAEGKAELERHVPGVGPRAANPPSRKNNDPMDNCDPMGVPRILTVEIIAPHNAMEIIQLPGRILEVFEWHHDWRVVWTDGRQLPKGEDLEPKWNGYSVGHWEGDTFVVNLAGFDDRTWIDRFGYPHSDEMRLEERYRRTGADTLEFTMTITDPKFYSRPWVSEKKTFRQNREKAKTWDEQAYCVPSVEFGFNQLIRDGGFGNQK